LIVHDQVETPSTITLKSASAIAEIRSEQLRGTTSLRGLAETRAPD